MPLVWSKVEIQIRGLSQKEGDMVRVPGTMRHAINVEFAKPGEINKRRGYRRVATALDVHGNTVEDVFQSVATIGGELVLYGANYLYSVVSDRGLVDGGSLVRRGPVPRGNYHVQHVVSSALATEAEEA